MRPDEDVSAALQETADRARRQGGYAAAALQRAAELSRLGLDPAVVVTVPGPGRAQDVVASVPV
jgi:hypothetical protein